MNIIIRNFQWVYCNGIVVDDIKFSALNYFLIYKGFDPLIFKKEKRKTVRFNLNLQF